MNQDATHSSYLAQFLAKRQSGPAGQDASLSRSYQQDFLASARKEEALKKASAPQPEVKETEVQEEKGLPKEAPSPSLAKPELLWQNNAGRFQEEEMPYLSAKSVKQLESNYRELMLIEANASALAKGKNKFYVTSCSNRDGKTISAISMAYALSFYSGKEVLLVDLNTDAPSIDKLFGIGDGPGLHELYDGSARFDEVILPTRHQGLSVLPLGAGSQRLREGEKSLVTLFNIFSQTFDYVICDGSSVMSSSSALRNIRMFDAAFIVIVCEKTRWEVVQIAEDKIKKSGGPTAIGIIFNRRKYYIPKFVYKIISK